MRAGTIVTSNLDFTEWDQALPSNRLLSSASLYRLRHNAHCLVLDGQSCRAPKHLAFLVHENADAKRPVPPVVSTFVTVGGKRIKVERFRLSYRWQPKPDSQTRWIGSAETNGREGLGHFGVGVCVRRTVRSEAPTWVCKPY